MKKLLALILALIMTMSVALVFTGCEKDVDEDDKSVSDNREEDEDAEEDEESDKDVEEDEDEESDKDEDSDKEEVDEDEDNEEEVNLERGKIKGSVYTSKTIGIKMTLPENYVFYDDEEIKAALQTGQAILDVEDMDTSKSMFDMMCLDNSTGASINVMYLNLKALNATMFSEEDMVDLNVDQLVSTYDFIKSCEKTTVKIDGKKYHAVSMIVDYGYGEIQQVTVYKKVGDYMAQFTFTVLGDNTLEDMLDLISHI